MCRLFCSYHLVSSFFCCCFSIVTLFFLLLVAASQSSTTLHIASNFSLKHLTFCLWNISWLSSYHRHYLSYPLFSFSWLRFFIISIYCILYNFVFQQVVKQLFLLFRSLSFLLTFICCLFRSLSFLLAFIYCWSRICTFIRIFLTSDVTSLSLIIANPSIWSLHNFLVILPTFSCAS